MTNAGIDALCPCFAQLNRICIRSVSAGQCAKPAAALTLAPARQIAAECLDLEFRPLREKLLVLEHGIVSLQPEPVEKSTGLSETIFHEDRVWRIYFFPATHAARFAVVFVVEIESEDELAIFRHIPHKTRAAVVKFVVAIGLAESVLLPVIIVKIVPEWADRAVHFREIAVIPIAAKDIPGCEMKWRIQARHFHDEIQGSTWLTAVCRAAPARISSIRSTASRIGV